MNAAAGATLTAASLPDGGAHALAAPSGVASAQTPKSITIDAYCTVGIDREYNLTEAQLVTAMDKAGVDRAVIAPPDRFLAVYNREGNESVRKAALAYKTRLLPSCSVNPWYGKPAIEELRRALGEGARMVILHPFIQGFLANDEIVFPVIEEAEKAKVPVYIHTGPPGNATPWKVVDLADQYPQVDFIMGHCGSTDLWADVIHAATAAPNVYCESSMARPFRFVGYMEAGSSKGIMGSYAPINELTFEWEQMRTFLPKETHADCLGNNFCALLRKRGPV